MTAPAGAVVLAGDAGSIWALYVDGNGVLTVETSTDTAQTVWLSDGSTDYLLSVAADEALVLTSGTPGADDYVTTVLTLPTPTDGVQSYLSVVAGTTQTQLVLSSVVSNPPVITSQRIGLQLGVSGALTLDAPIVDPLSESAQLRVRALSQLAVAMPNAIPIFGRPHIPAIWVQGTPVVTLTEGVGHMQVVPDVPATGSHPAKGAGAPSHVWLASDCAAGQVASWAEHSGGPALVGENNGSGYANRVTRTVFGTNGRSYSYPGVEFVPSEVDAFSLNLGTISQPYSFVFVGVINSYPTRKYGHYFLDGGDGQSARSLMLYQLNSCLLCTDHTVEGGVYVRAPHDFAPQPRMFFGIFNGSSSYIGHYDTDTKNVVKGRVSNRSAGKFVIGRRQGYKEEDLASHITLYEIRYYAKALTMAQLDEDYKQIAATYKFGYYARSQGKP